MSRRPSRRAHRRRPIPEVLFVYAEARRQGLSIDELSRRAGVASGTIGYWRNHLADPRYSLLKAVYQALGHDLGRIDFDAIK